MSTRVDYDIRAYEDRDEDAVLDLLNASLGGGPAGQRPASFFRWKHLENPFGRSYMIVADAGGDIVGLRAFMRWEFKTNGAVRKAVRAVDTATHPDWQGKGIFSRLTMAAIEDLASQADFIFNTPNDKSLPGYLKMGWRLVGRIPVSLRIVHPVRLAGRALGIGASSDPATGTTPSLGGAFERASDPDASDQRLRTPRSARYLQWRYEDAPLLHYRYLDTADGAAVYRVRRRGRFTESTITEIFSGSGPTGSALLSALRGTGGDYLAGHAAHGTAGARTLGGPLTVRAPGPRFVVRPLRGRSDPDPLVFGNWSLSIGDLEIF